MAYAKPMFKYATSSIIFSVTSFAAWKPGSGFNPSLHVEQGSVLSGTLARIAPVEKISSMSTVPSNLVRQRLFTPTRSGRFLCSVPDVTKPHHLTTTMDHEL